jgi:hypothetical protein
VTRPGAAEPFWLTAFLDYPAGEFDAGVGFWRAATGYGLSTPRGEAGEFATLVPSSGNDYLRVQRLGEGPTGLHLDVHVPETWEAAERAMVAGAELVSESPHGYFVLRSPAGFPFCLVTAAADVVPPAADWPAGHRSRVSRFCLDIPRRSYADEVVFFEQVLGGQWLTTPDHETALRLAGTAAIDIRLQPAELARSVTAHLHVATDDLEAEVARLSAHGAMPRASRRGKTILEAPGGAALCVVAVEGEELA